jgi:hypothetical protein
MDVLVDHDLPRPQHIPSIFFYEETKFTFQTVLGTHLPSSTSPNDTSTAPEAEKKNPLQLSQTRSAGATESIIPGYQSRYPDEKLLVTHGLGD